jgi:hypothetical protein
VWHVLSFTGIFQYTLEKIICGILSICNLLHGHGATHTHKKKRSHDVVIEGCRKQTERKKIKNKKRRKSIGNDLPTSFS